MTVPGDAARRAWANTELRLWPETYRLVRFDLADSAFSAAVVETAGGRFCCLVRDAREISLTVDEETWQRFADTAPPHAVQGPLKAITFDADLPPDLVGYLAPAAEALSAAEIPIVPQCSFSLDHVLVPARDAERALSVLQGLVDAARQ